MKKAVLVGSALMIWASLLSAAGWRVSPALTTRVFFTDNVFLVPENTESDTAIQLLPSITARRDSRRLRTRFAYGPSLLFYANNDDLNNVYNILQANANVELIERYFFLNITANANQQLINPRSRAAFDAIGNPDAFTQTAGIRVTPDIRLPLLRGDFAEVRLRPGLNFSFAADTAGGSQDGGVGGSSTQLNITSGRAFTRMPWSLNYSKQVFDADTNDGFGRADARVGYRFNPRYRADVTIGYDEGRYASTSDNSGARWRLTGTWTPNQRTRVALGVGEAFYGGDWNLDLSHRQKHSVWTANYDVKVENARGEILDRQVAFFDDPFGNPIADPIGERQVDVDLGTPALIDDVYVRDNFRLGWNWARGRNNVRIDLRYDRRDYQDLDLDTRDARAFLNLSRRLTGRMTGRIRFDYWNHDEDDPIDAFDFDQYGARVGMSYRLGPRTNANLDLQHRNRSSDNPLEEYTENRVDLSVSYVWNRGL